MKKIILIFTAIVSLGLGSCKKCATCTFDENGTILEDEVCGRGKIYQENLDQHEKSGWVCADK